MNIVLLTFSAEEMYLEYCSYSLNCLKAYLLEDRDLKEQCTVSVKYYNGSSPAALMDQYMKEIMAFINEADIHVAGFGCYVWNMEILLALAREIKKLHPEIRIILGGPQVLHGSEEILRDNPFVDFIVRGDGEAALRDLVRHHMYSEGALGDIDGISYRHEGGTASTPHRAPLPLEKIPSPYLEGLIDIKQGYVYPIEGSRGCLFKCAYCHWGISRLSYFPLEKVKREITWLIDRGITIGMFVDSAINFDRERAAELIQFIDERSPGIVFTVFLSIHFLTAEFIELLNNSPLIYGEIGIQSLNPVTLKNINRHMVKDEELDMLRLMKNPFTIDLIYGLPGDTLETFARTFQEIFRYTHVINMFRLDVNPGTRLWEKRKEYEIEIEAETSRILSSYTYSRKDMEETTRFKQNYEEIFSPVLCGELPRERILELAASINMSLFQFVNDYSDYLVRNLSHRELSMLKLGSIEEKRDSLQRFLDICEG